MHKVKKLEKIMKKVKILIFTSFVLFTSGCSLLMSYQSYTYTPPSMKGIIIDNDTNSSISNASITKPLYDYKIISDTNGSFFIPEDSSHSITVHPMQSNNMPTSMSYIFIVFKSGYEPKVCTSGSTNASIHIRLNKDDTFQKLDRNKLINMYIKYNSDAIWNYKNTDKLEDDVECLKNLEVIDD